MSSSNNNSGRNSPTNSSILTTSEQPSIPTVNQPNIDDLFNEYIDTSGNVTVSYDVSGSVTYVSHVQDISTNNVFSATCEDNTIMPVPVPIVSDLSSITVHGPGYDITNETGKSADGSFIIRETFASSTDPSNNDVNINANLTEIVTTYIDASNNNAADILLNQIKLYAADINCSDFHGKGTIDDYAVLFQAAGRIANESKHMELDIDIEGFSEFGKAADDLANLFESFITKLQNVNIITDIGFLTTISIALGKIVNLSKIFGKFKETIFTTTTIQVPKSAHDTKVVLQGVMDEVNCAMQYINYFVSPVDASLNGAQLSDVEKNIIAKSIDTIDSWNVLCEQGVSIAMASDPDVQYIQQASSQLKNTTFNLKTVTNTLKNKLASFNITC
uniref:Uncharacterized protein n=1 Tax=viral metagenome TaxID=1070528 RepID=A0A6C0LA86_9ZZZZ